MPTSMQTARRLAAAVLVLVLGAALAGCSSGRKAAAVALLDDANSSVQEFGPSAARFTLRVPRDWRVVPVSQTGGVRLEDRRRSSFCFVFVSMEHIGARDAAETSHEMYEMEGAKVSTLSSSSGRYSFTVFGKPRAAGYAQGSSRITLFDRAGKIVTEGHSEGGTGIAAAVAQSLNLKF